VCGEVSGAALRCGDVVERGCLKDGSCASSDGSTQVPQMRRGKGNIGPRCGLAYQEPACCSRMPSVHSNSRVRGNVPTKNVDMVPPSASTVLTFLTNCMCDAVPHGSFVLYIKRQSFFVFPGDL